MTGAQARTLTFDFQNKSWVGPFGPAVSTDLSAWRWGEGLTARHHCCESAGSPQVTKENMVTQDNLFESGKCFAKAIGDYVAVQD